MKDTILVNLVSDQTIPNVQFVKWYFNQNHLPMKIFLLSTKEMENKQKSECIKSALALPENFVEWETILTDENDISKTQNILNELKKIDPTTLTPIESMNVLFKVVNDLKK